MKFTCTFAWLFTVSTVLAQASCPTSVTTKVPAPSVAPGYEGNLVATGLTRPRGIRFDRAGHLLVVDRGVGVKVLTLQDDGGSCVTVSDTKVLIANPDVS